MAGIISVSDLARRLGVPPRRISDLFYQRVLRDEICPIVGGRRLIPETYVEEVGRALRHKASLAGQAEEGRCG